MTVKITPAQRRVLEAVRDHGRLPARPDMARRMSALGLYEIVRNPDRSGPLYIPVLTERGRNAL